MNSIIELRPVRQAERVYFCPTTDQTKAIFGPASEIFGMCVYDHEGIAHPCFRIHQPGGMMRMVPFSGPGWFRVVPESELGDLAAARCDGPSAPDDRERPDPVGAWLPPTEAEKTAEHAAMVSALVDRVKNQINKASGK